MRIAKYVQVLETSESHFFTWMKPYCENLKQLYLLPDTTLCPSIGFCPSLVSKMEPQCTYQVLAQVSALGTVTFRGTLGTVLITSNSRFSECIFHVSCRDCQNYHTLQFPFEKLHGEPYTRLRFLDLIGKYEYE